MMKSLMSPSGYDYNSKTQYPSEVDWGPSPRTLKRSQPQPVHPQSWDCGDAVKKKELVKRFGQVSSAHGSVYIFSDEKVSKCTRIFYKSLFVTCLFLVVTNTALILQTAWSSESSYMNNINKASAIGKEEDPDYFPIYPKITLCRKPPFKKDFNSSYRELLEYVTLALGYPFVNWTPEEVSYVFFILTRRAFDVSEAENREAEAFYKRLQDLETRFKKLKKSDPNFDIRKFVVKHSYRCEDVFSSCQAMVFSYNCCEIFKPVLTSLGLCFTLERTELIEQLQINLPVDFAFILDLISPEPTEKMTEVGFEVFLTDPHEETYIEGQDGQKVVPGLVTTISTQLMKHDRQELYTPWYGVPQCPKLQYGDHTERYSPLTCGAYYMFQSLRDACGCDSILSQGVSPSRRSCEPSDQYDCFIYKSLQSNLSDLDDKCPDPCFLYTFKNDASYIGLGGENISRVEIMYNSKHYIYHEFRTFTFSGLFSQIGGVLGLYLGASIITVVEMISFIVSWLWYTCIPSRSSRVQPSHNEPYTVHLST